MKFRIRRRQFLQTMSAAGLVSMPGRSAALTTQVPPTFRSVMAGSIRPIWERATGSGMSLGQRTSWVASRPPW